MSQLDGPVAAPPIDEDHLLDRLGFEGPEDALDVRLLVERAKDDADSEVFVTHASRPNPVHAGSGPTTSERFLSSVRAISANTRSSTSR